MQDCCVTLRAHHHCPETLRVFTDLYSYLWFVTSLKNIQKLPAKSLQLRESNSGKEEDVSGNRTVGTHSTEHQVLQKLLQEYNTAHLRGGLWHQPGPVTMVKRLQGTIMTIKKYKMEQSEISEHRKVNEGIREMMQLQEQVSKDKYRTIQNR